MWTEAIREGFLKEVGVDWYLKAVFGKMNVSERPLRGKTTLAEAEMRRVSLGLGRWLRLPSCELWGKTTELTARDLGSCLG